MKKILTLVFFLFLGVQLAPALAQEYCDKMYDAGIGLMQSKKYEEAITKFQAASECNKKLSQACSGKIAECKKLMKQATSTQSSGVSSSAFKVGRSEVSFPASGGSENVAVSGGNQWMVFSSSDWCSASKNGNTVSISCSKPNESIRARSAVIEIKNGNDIRTINVKQAAAEEFLRVSTASLAFSSKGNSQEVTILTNTNWDYSSVPHWCEVVKTGNHLKVVAQANNSNKERSGTIVVNSANKEVEIRLSQNIGSDILSASKSTLSYAYTGGTEVVSVYTNSGDWIIGDFPKWCQVRKINANEIAIECLENNTTKPRSETILVKNGNQTFGIKVEQSRGYTPSTVASGSTYSSKVIKGRDVSFGITAGMVLPSFSTSTSGDFIGSAVNYGYGSDLEKPSYSSEVGFNIGLIVDVRLVKNLYLQTGLSYTNFAMKNKFSGTFTDRFEQSATTYIKGNANDEFTEKYTLSYLELPILFSYRFKLAEKTNIQINAGPYIGYGLSGKCKISGSTDWPSLLEYYTRNDQLTGDSYYMHCNVNGEIDLFGKEGNSANVYTTGDASTNEYEYDFDEAPYKRLNAGISLGAAIEFHGFNIGLSYDFGLTNMANKDYWESERMAISEYPGSVRMEGYKQKLSKLQVKVGYIFRW